MSTTNLLPNDIDDLLNFGGPEIEEQETGDSRFPFLLLIDTSSSTSELRGKNAEPDIARINQALAMMYRKLKYPAQGDPLELTNHQVDLCVIAYNTMPTVVQKWVAASDLPDQAPVLTATGGTSTGIALMSAVEVILARLKRYKDQGLPRSGMPYLIHMTDGEPTDVQLDNNNWRIVRERIKELTQTDQRLTLWNFVAPNGYEENHRAPSDANGKPMTGADVLERWLGPAPVKPIGDGAENFAKLAEFIVKTITAVSQQAGAQAEMTAGFGHRSLIDDAF